jgi:hypothetical protein
MVGQHPSSPLHDLNLLDWPLPCLCPVTIEHYSSKVPSMAEVFLGCLGRVIGHKRHASFEILSASIVQHTMLGVGVREKRANRRAQRTPLPRPLPYS